MLRTDCQGTVTAYPRDADGVSSGPARSVPLGCQRNPAFLNSLSMAPSPSTRSRSFRRGLSERLIRLRRKLQHSPEHISSPSLETPATYPDIASQSVPSPVWCLFLAKQRSSAELTPGLRADCSSADLSINGDDEARSRKDQSSLHSDHLSLSVIQSTLDNHDGDSIDSSDLWSAAYREAVNSLGKDIDVAILRDSSAAQLFAELEGIDKGMTERSVFLRGVAYLRSIQVPLERFKLALDLASPLANLDPVASTVIGAIRSVTAVSTPSS